MLPIHIEKNELFNESDRSFIQIKETTLKLEHSLVSISKWESKWKKPFLDGKEKTEDEINDYISCMSINGDIDVNVIRCITQKDLKRINDYIADKKTASYVQKDKTSNNRSQEQVTSELIYYWMIAYNIPSEYEKWHLSRLLMLIEICERKNAPEKKMTQAEIIARNKEWNKQRRAEMNSKG